MEPTKLAILGLAALLHAGWNLISKRSADKQVFLWLTMVVSSVLFLPVLLFRRPVIGPVWPYLVSSGALEALYLLLLGGAYQRGDLSLVYPVARGSAPVFATIFGWVFLGEKIPGPGLVGIALVASGVYLTYVRPTGRAGLRALAPSFGGGALWFSLLTGLTIAGYSVVDRTGVRLITPVTYVYLVFVEAAALLAPYMALRRWPRVVQEWRSHKSAVVAVAVMSLGAYLLVLLVMRTTVVGYVSSVREVSVVFAAALGTFVLREPFGPWRILGSLVIVAGIVAIAAG